jgi:hypothetical protein
LYGTTYGDDNGSGTVFRLDMGLRPLVRTVPTAGPTGSAVMILGTNLTSASSVTFGGLPAPSFTINSTGTAISTTVPTGAKTGEVRVRLADGMLKSNVAFRVTQ